MFELNCTANTQEEALDVIRVLRNSKLAECDWTQTVDAPLTDEQKTAWATYRQALRDITTDLTVTINDKGYVEFEAIAWPEIPNV